MLLYIYESFCMKMRLSLRFPMLYLLALTACDKPAGIVEGVAKSSAYYQSHIGEAKTTTEKCMAFEPNSVNAMALSKQTDWQETADRMSCHGAIQVAQLELVRINQQRSSDAAAKYK